jgi:phospholipase/lecithinase/hemolysin
MAAVYSGRFLSYVATSPVDARAVMGCSTLTLVSGASGSATTYLWADDIHPGPNWQTQVGSAAVTRATTNPF